MGTGSCKIVPISGKGRNGITQDEVSVYLSIRATIKALSEQADLMMDDFTGRMDLGGAVEAGPLRLESPDRHVFASGSFFVPLKAAAAAAGQ